MVSISLVDVRENCPVDVSSVVDHSRKFKSLSNVRVSNQNINNAKNSLLEAKAELELMISTLSQVLYSPDIIKTRTDEVLHSWMLDNIGRFLKGLDYQEQLLIIDLDDPDPRKSRIGVSRLSSYSNLLRTAARAIVFESLSKANKEWKAFQETTEIKKDKRLYLYILFQVISIALNSLYNITRQRSSSGSSGISKETPKGFLGLISKQGQENIRMKHQKNTGEKIDPTPPENLVDHGDVIGEVVENGVS